MSILIFNLSLLETVFKIESLKESLEKLNICLYLIVVEYIFSFSILSTLILHDFFVRVNTLEELFWIFAKQKGISLNR